MSDETQPEPQQAGGRLVVTAEATVYKGGRHKAEQDTEDRDEQKGEQR